ncbi:MAG: hypothetical protein ABIQ31_12015 [Ferruginibacter sp.]
MRKKLLIITALQSFSVTGGTLEIIVPPFDQSAQVISCPFNLGSPGILSLVNGISITGNSNPNGFRDSIFLSQIGKLLINGAFYLRNKKDKNINALAVKRRCGSGQRAGDKSTFEFDSINYLTIINLINIR